MAYTTGSKILAADYNGLATSTNTPWGVGSGDTGYGQSSPLASITAGTKINASTWASLVSRIATMASHQGTVLGSVPSIVAGGKVIATPALASNITLINATRRNAAASGTDITAGGVLLRTTGWYSTVIKSYTITFSSENAARYFFNAGGQLRVGFARSGGTAYAKNVDWTNLCSACGTIVLTSGAATIAGTAYTGTTKIGGSGTPLILISANGYHNLTNTVATVFRQRSTDALYGTIGQNNIAVEMSKLAHQVFLTVRYTDSAADSDTPDLVTGTLTTTLVARPPSITHLSNTWGTPTISGIVTGL